MRLPAQRLTRGQVARTVSVPAPVGGWNARDSLADMDKRDAVILDNMFPTVTDVRVRLGYSDHVTGITGTVETLMDYSPPSGSQKLFAAAGTAIYDVTTAGVVGAAAVSSLNNARWQHTMFVNSAGNWLIAVNGADGVRSYNGSVWATETITGATAADLIHVNSHKNRLWFVEKNSLKTWYLATSAKSGAATAFDLSSIFSRGGFLVALATWTLDVGFGIDDYAVFITSEGQVAVYEGTDPAAPATWALIGVYQVGNPIGRRCFMKYGGDLFLVLKEGLTPLSRALKTEQDMNNQRVTAKIQNAMSEYAGLYSGNYGWQAILYPAENMLLVNIPTGTNQAVQFAMNTISGSWCRFVGWNATCWERHNDRMYFGGNGFVAKAWDTFADDGVDIRFQGLQSFSPHGANTQMKQVKLLRPVVASDGAPAVNLGVNADFDTSPPTGVLAVVPASAAVWGSGLWDVGTWGGDPTIRRDWQTAYAMGYSFAAHMLGAVRTEQLRWIATDYLIQDGGVV